MSDLRQQLSKLEVKGLIRLARTEPDLEYLFRHALLQDAAYASILHRDKQTLHRAVAKTLERLFPGREGSVAPVLAHHFLKAGDEKRALKYYLSAGQQARSVVALDEAANYYRQAMALIPHHETAQRAETQHKLGEALWVLGRLHGALEAYGASFRLYEEIGDIEGAGAAQRQMGRMYWEAGERDRALYHYHRALEILEDGPESTELAWALSSISQMHMLASEDEQAIKWGNKALALAEKLGAEDVRVHALNNVGTSLLLFASDIERGEAMLKESGERALALGMPHDACRAFYNLSEALYLLGRYAEARELLLDMLPYVKRAAASLFIISYNLGLANVDWTTGDWSAALNRRPRIKGLISNQLAIGHVVLWASTLFGWIDITLGQPQAALEGLKATLELARSSAELQTTVPHLGRLAQTYADLGMRRETQQYIDEMLVWIEEAARVDWRSVPHLLFACRWLSALDEEGARGEARRCVKLLERAERDTVVPEHTGSLAEARGALALAEGRIEQSVQDLQEAEGVWEKLGRPYDRARALGSLGEAQTGEGKQAEAATSFGAAMTVYHDLAKQLEDPAQRDSFLSSSAVQKTQRAAASLTQ